MAKNSGANEAQASVRAARARASSETGGRGNGSGSRRGVGSAGSALLGAASGGGRGSGLGATAVAQTPATPSAPPPTVQPFLTPDQQRLLDNWNTSYGEQLASLGQADTNAVAKWTADTGAENLKFAQNNNLTNQAEAARGLGFSSIRMNALNDLAVTHAAAINTINTNRDTAINNDQITRQTLGGQNTTNQNHYAGLAVQNAQAITPVTGDNAGVAGTAGANSTTPTPAAHPAAAAPAPPTAVGTASSVQEARSTSRAETTAMHSAALSRVQQPGTTATKPPGIASAGLGLKVGPFNKVGAPR